MGHSHLGRRRGKKNLPQAPSVSSVTGRRETPVSFVNSPDSPRLWGSFEHSPACDEFLMLHQSEGLISVYKDRKWRTRPAFKEKTKSPSETQKSSRLTFRTRIISDKVGEIFQQLPGSNSVSLPSSSGKAAQPRCDTCHSGARAAFFKHSCRVLQHNN